MMNEKLLQRWGEPRATPTIAPFENPPNSYLGHVLLQRGSKFRPHGDLDARLVHK